MFPSILILSRILQQMLQNTTKHWNYELVHFWSMFSFCTPWKHQKNFGFLVLAGGAKGEHWPKTLYWCRVLYFVKNHHVVTWSPDLVWEMESLILLWSYLHVTFCIQLAIPECYKPWCESLSLQAMYQNFWKNLNTLFKQVKNKE